MIQPSRLAMKDALRFIFISHLERKGRSHVTTIKRAGMNLAVLRRSRHKPQPGDIFALRPPDGLFLFGRVIANDAKPVGDYDAILFYIYRVRSAEKRPIPELRPTDLLIPPQMTNLKPWTQGIFEHLENRPLTPDDCLPNHAFRDVMGRAPKDEHGRPVPGPVEPWGIFMLGSHYTVDNEVSQALGIPLASG